MSKNAEVRCTIDYGTARPLAVLASSNKGLEGPPGIGFALCDRTALASATGNSPSLCLDLAAQSAAFDATGQWRFTPPVQVVAATVEALRDEGGAAARLARYRANMETLQAGMSALGFAPLLGPEIQSPIIASFTADRIPGFEFQHLYDGLAANGLLIYPGKASGRQTFRIGCIGQLHPKDITDLLRAISRGLTASSADSRSGATRHRICPNSSCASTSCCSAASRTF